MARKSTIFDDVMVLPWPVGAVMAVLCYPSALLLSAFWANKSPMLSGLSKATLMLWPFLALLFAIASLISYLNQRKTKKLYSENRTISQIRSLSWLQFESYVGQAFREKGYTVVETPTGPDGGVDLVLRKDGDKTYVQCKHWKVNKVGVEKVRELLGSMTAGGAEHGVLVTTGEFTSAAKAFATQHGIKLLNGDELSYFVRVTNEEDELSPESDDPAPPCPRCSSIMIKRQAKKGGNSGRYFWGCSNFPKCRGKRSI